MMTKLEGMKKWWKDVIESGGHVTEKITLSSETITLISKKDLRDAFEVWRISNNEICLPIDIREFGKSMKAIVPDLAYTRPRVNKRQVPHIAFPKLSSLS